jgi:hypothetical protein
MPGVLESLGKISDAILHPTPPALTGGLGQLLFHVLYGKLTHFPYYGLRSLAMSYENIRA